MDAPLEVARSLLGYVEHGGPHGNDGNITSFWDWWDAQTGERDQGYSWCGAFVSYCFATTPGARMTIGGKPGFIYCPAGEAWFRSQGLLVDPADAKPNDVAFFDFTSYGDKPPAPHHTGIVEKVDPIGKTITCIEGNTSSGMAGSPANGGGVYRRTRSWMVVHAIGHAAWVNHPAPPNPEEPEHMNRTRVQATPAGTKASFTGLDQKDHPVEFTNVVGLVPIDKANVWAASTSLMDDQAVIFADPATTVIVTFT